MVWFEAMIQLQDFLFFSHTLLGNNLTFYLLLDLIQLLHMVQNINFPSTHYLFERMQCVVYDTSPSYTLPWELCCFFFYFPHLGKIYFMSNSFLGNRQKLVMQIIFFMNIYMTLCMMCRKNSQNMYILLVLSHNNIIK